MHQNRFDKILDYFPIIAYFGFWFQGAFAASLLTQDWRLVVLGFVTAPAIIAMVVAIFRIRKRHRGQ